jgi:hypothetical protein
MLQRLQQFVMDFFGHAVRCSRRLQPPRNHAETWPADHDTDPLLSRQTGKPRDNFLRRSFDNCVSRLHDYTLQRLMIYYAGSEEFEGERGPPRS